MYDIIYMDNKSCFMDNKRFNMIRKKESDYYEKVGNNYLGERK